MPSNNYPKQKPGFFGVQRVWLKSEIIGGTNYGGGASPLTANTTTIFRMGGAPCRCVFNALVGVTATVPSDADGTILAYAYKYDASADAAVQISAALDLEALVTREGTKAAHLSTASDATLTFDTGDALEIHVINNSAAINAQPAGLVFTAELLMLE